VNLLYLSSDPIGIPCLEHLAAGSADEINLTGVVTAPDRRQGRGKKLKRNPVAEAADPLGVPALQTERLQPDELESFAPFDAALVFAFGQILSAKVLALRPGRFLNLHPSPLPLLRGPSPLETALAEGWRSTEICLMEVAKRMDAGPVARRMPLEILPADSGPTLRERAGSECIQLLETLSSALRGEVDWEQQDESSASWSRIIHKKDGWIDFSLPAERLVCRSRAFAGWPGALLRLKGETIRVEHLSSVDASGRPGEILQTDGRLVIAAGNKAVSIGSLQRPTRKMVPWDEFRKAVPLKKGRILSYPLSEPLVRHTRKL